MKDVGGVTDMDLYTANGELFSNVIEKVQGRKFPGTPRSLAVLPKYNYLEAGTLQRIITTALTVATTDGFWIVDISDLNVGYDLETMFYFKLDPGSPLFAAFHYYGTFYFSDNGVYRTQYDLVWGSGGSGLFGTPTAIAGDNRPNINITADQYFTYVFDELNGRFLFLNFNGVYSAFSNQNSAGETPELLPNDITDKMLYYGRNKLGTNQSSGFAVMQHPTDPSKRYLYELGLANASSMTAMNPMRWKREITGLNFNQATLYANDEIQTRSLYYSTGSKVYKYLIDSGEESELNLQGFGAGETITYIKNMYWTGAAAESDRFNYLAIGTQVGGNYKIYLYNLIAGEPIGSPANILQGEGKAVKMQYITPEFTVNIGSYQYPLGY